MRGENSSESGIFHRREFEPRKLSRSVIFPRSVDPENVRAEMKDGLLTVKARIAGAAHIVDFMPVAA
jgi:HSP20 family molecular chaperone IbpA